MSTLGEHIVLRDISKDFINTNDNSISNVIENFSFDFPNGSITTILGPSGCGKTTLLKIMSGLDRRYEGEVLMQGKKISLENKKTFGFVFQDPNLLPWKNVEENISFFGDLLKKKIKLEKTIEDVGLTGFNKHFPNELSGGMKKRVSLARAIAIEPNVIFMDEPFGALDEFTRLKMNKLLLDIWQEFKTTIIFVTHNIEEAMYLSDTIITLTPLPAKIKNVYDVRSIPRPRDHKVRITPEYISLLENIHKDFNL